MNILKRIIRKIFALIHFTEIVNYIVYLRASERCDIDPHEALRQLKQHAPMPQATAEAKNKLNKPYKYDLTVIIPAYNAEKWIEECMDSVVLQKTKYSFCVKVTNDGSTDNTHNKLQRYTSFANVIIHNQENKGYSGARNVALREISSRYIMFVDSDDRLEPDAIEKLLDTGYANNADIVEGSAYAFNENGLVYEIKKKKCENTRDGLWGGPSLKIIRSELFENLKFPDGYLYEDTIIGYLLYPQARVISTIPDVIYNYRIHPQSITQTRSNNLNRVDSFWIMILMNNLIEKIGITKDIHIYHLNLSHVIRTYKRTILLDENIKKCIFACTGDFIQSNYADFLLTKCEYKRLAKAIVNKQYGKYCVLCETHHF